MCYVLYIGTDHPLPTIPWDEQDRHLNTADLREHDRAVAKHFSKPHTKYLGSDLGCGCGFRHLSFQDGGWPEEGNIGRDPDDAGSSEDAIHRELFEFLSPLLASGERLELYGCWDGDFADPVEHREEITPERLLDRSFFFRERGLYTVTRGPDGGHAPIDQQVETDSPSPAAPRPPEPSPSP